MMEEEKKFRTISVESKVVFDPPYVTNNLRLHSPSGSYAIFGQRTVHFYELTFQPKIFYSYSWIVIKEVSKDANITTKKSPYREQWLEQKTLKDCGITVANVHWLNNASNSILTAILFSNQTFIIVKKSYQIEFQCSFDLKGATLRSNRQVILTDSVKCDCGPVTVFSSLTHEQSTIIFTGHDNQIKLWNLIEGKGNELTLIPLREVDLKVAVQWMHLWNSPTSLSNVDILIYDSFSGQFEHLEINLSDQKSNSSSSSSSSPASKVFGNEEIAGLTIYDCIQNEIILSDSRILYLDIYQQLVLPLDTSLLLEHNLISLQDHFLYAYNTQTKFIDRFRVSVSGETSITFIDSFEVDELVSRSLGGTVDRYENCLVLCSMVPGVADGSREVQINYQLSKTHMQVSILPLLPSKLKLDDDAIQALLHALSNIINDVNCVNHSPIYFALFVQAIIDYRKDELLDVTVPLVDPKLHEAIAFGEQHEVGTRSRHVVEENEEDEEEDDDEDDGEEADDLELMGMEDDQGSKPAKSKSKSKAKKPAKGKGDAGQGGKGGKKSRDDKHDHIFLLNAIHKKYRETYGLDAGREFQKVFDLLVRAALKFSNITVETDGGINTAANLALLYLFPQGK